MLTAYLEEVPRMVAGSDVFEVFTHLDVAIRYWPTVEVGPFDPRPFEELIRAAMGPAALLDTGRGCGGDSRN